MAVPLALDDLRILDLSGPAGFYGGKLLADLGADVVRVEAPVPAADPGPYIEGGQSLYRYHFHTNKRSIALNLATSGGREILQHLLSAADVLVESLPDGEARALALDPDVLSAAHPTLIHISITNFGREGPYAQYKAGDLVAQAMGGLMSITGFPGESPMRVGAEQAYHSTGLHVAVATLLAVHQRAKDGRGRHVEIPVQDALAMAILQTANFNFYTIQGIIPTRSGNEPRVAQRGARNPAIFECKDGWIVYTTPPQPPHLWKNFVAWLSEHGAAADLADPKYEEVDARTAESAHIVEVQRAFFAARGRSELYHEAQRRGLLCMPVQDVADLSMDEQLRARGFFVDVEHPELGRSFDYPGAPYKLSETPFSIRRRAPFLGEDGVAVLSDWLGIPTAEALPLLTDGGVG